MICICDWGSSKEKSKRRNAVKEVENKGDGIIEKEKRVIRDKERRESQ